jgi:hypothetical protein
VSLVEVHPVTLVLDRDGSRASWRRRTFAYTTSSNATSEAAPRFFLS